MSRVVTAIISAGVTTAALLVAALLAYPAVSKYLNDRSAVVDAKFAALEQKIGGDGAKAAVAQLSAEVGKVTAALAHIDDKVAKLAASPVPAGAGTSTAALETKITAAVETKMTEVNATLARLEKSVRDSLKTPDGAEVGRSLANVTTTLGELKTGLQGVSSAVAGLRADKAQSLATLGTSMDGIKTDLASPAQTIKSNLDASVTSIKTDLGASIAAIRADIDKLAKAQAAAAAAPAQKQAQDQSADLVVISVAAPAAKAATSPALAAAATSSTGSNRGAKPIPRMSVHYDRIGGLDDNGQVVALAQRLRGLLKDRQGCAIAVSGHADTLGSDAVNLDISKERAAKVVAALKAEFPDGKIPITEASWGERALAEWTPNNTPRKANRRVDIRVTCTS